MLKLGHSLIWYILVFNLTEIHAFSFFVLNEKIPALTYCIYYRKMTLYKKIHLIQETLKVNFHAIYKHNKIFSKLKVSPKKWYWM